MALATETERLWESIVVLRNIKVASDRIDGVTKLLRQYGSCPRRSSTG